MARRLYPRTKDMCILATETHCSCLHSLPLRGCLHGRRKNLYVYLTNAYDKSIFSAIGDGKSFTSLDGLRSHINTSHLPKRHECQDCAYKTNCASHLKRHRDRWHSGSTQELKTCVYWQRRLIVHVCILCLLGAVYMEGGRTWH